MSNSLKVIQFTRRNIGWFSVVIGLGIVGINWAWGETILSNYILRYTITAVSIICIVFGIVLLVLAFLNIDNEVVEPKPDPTQIDIDLSKYSNVKDGEIWWSSEHGFGPSWHVYYEGKFKPNNDSPDLYPASIKTDPELREDVLTFDDTTPEYIIFIIDIVGNYSSVTFQENCKASGIDGGDVRRQLWYRIIRNRTDLTSWSCEDEIILLQKIRTPGHRNYFEVDSDIPLQKFEINGKPVKSGDQLQILYSRNPLIEIENKNNLIGDWILRDLKVILHN